MFINELSYYFVIYLKAVNLYTVCILTIAKLSFSSIPAVLVFQLSLIYLFTNIKV